jgi:ribose transport system substrate-binding protein
VARLAAFEVSVVATDNRAAGVMAAKAVADLLNGKGTIGMIKHVPGSDSTEEREQGFSEAIRLLAPKLRVVASEYCMSFRERALSVAKQMLAAHPNLGALFGSSEAATMGAMRALGVPGRQRRVKLVGFDASFSLREGLRDDVIDALVVQDPFYIGYAGVKTIVQKLNGVEPPKRIDSPARLVTAAHLDDADIVKLLDPPSTPR